MNHRMLLLVIPFVAVFFVACSTDGDGPPPTFDIGLTSPVSDISAGVGTGNVAGNIYTPQSVTIPVGNTITWTITSDEPHSVTFLSLDGAPPAGPPPAWPVNAEAGATLPFDGSQMINTGVVFKSTNLSVTFPQTGTFAYLCVIHPGMAGEVNVVAQGARFTTVSEAEATAKEETETTLSLLDQAYFEAEAKSGQAAQADGTTLWTVQVGAFTQTPTGPLELLENYPTELRVKAGDTVRWMAQQPHSVTFLSGQDMPAGDPTQIPPGKPSDEYDGTSLYHSGIFALSPESPTEFTLSFPAAGTYQYTCALHGIIGHNGVIIVE